MVQCEIQINICDSVRFDFRGPGVILIIFLFGWDTVCMNYFKVISNKKINEKSKSGEASCRKLFIYVT
jgi:hypothetical protein